MKTKLAILALALVCLSPAGADTVTSGNLSFTCLGQGCLSPTSGSFDYDNTSNQFLNLTLTWDGLNFLGPPVQIWPTNEQETAFLELIGSSSTPLKWGAFCAAGLGDPPPNCINGVGLGFFDRASVSVGLTVANGTVEFDNVGGVGVVTATHLVTTTPEPSLLVHLAIGLMGLGWRRLSRA